MVVIIPLSSPMLSCMGLTSGARQLVVQDAFEITASSFERVSWLTPYTIVASMSVPAGAEITTFFAPALMCLLASSFFAKKPVHSSTTSTPSSPQGNCSGSLSAKTLISSPLTMSASSRASTVYGNGPCAVSYFVK